MKKLLPLGLALLSAGTVAAQSTIPSQEVSQVAVSSISDNGKWLVGETGEGGLMIINLETGDKWKYNGSGADNDEGYATGSNREVSDDGTVVGEVNSIPSYWKNGKWNQLSGWVRDNTGYVYAVVGSITPDGSMIVGGLGKGGSSFQETDEDILMTYPCVWYRQDDGTYGTPVWLPYPEKDLFGRIPQYVHCLAVSQDGKTIGTAMRDGFGGFCQPVAHYLDENGEWQYKELGMNLINPNNIPLVPFPGEWNGDGVPNDFENYMTAQEYARFESQWYAWYEEQERLGYTEEEIAIRELHFAMEFMSGERKAAYEAKVSQWENGYVAWETAWKEYEQCVIDLFDTGWTFEFNNVFISPDGKYIYSSAMPAKAEDVNPVCIEVANPSNYTIYANEYNILVSSIAEDYSILGYPYDPDTDIYRMAYIFPEGDTTPVAFTDYMQEKNQSVYDWMEEHMYREVVTGITSSGAEQFDDRWCLGKAVCTPDLSLVGFAASTLYWAAPPANTSYITFLLNTGMDVEVEEVLASADATVNSLGDGRLEVKGEVSRIEIFNLSGMKVYEAVNPAGVVSTGLSTGVYVVKADSPSGVITKKVLF